jgi:hypothetical protein
LAAFGRPLEAFGTSVPFLPAIRALLRLAPLVALLTSLVPHAAFAKSSRVVLADARGPSEPLESELLGALRGQLRELDVEVVVVRAVEEPLARAARRAEQIARTEHALGVIWLELRPNKLSIFLYDSNGHLYARDVPPDGSAASQSEAIAIILRSAIAAMLEGHAVSMTEVPLPRPPAPPPGTLVTAGNPSRAPGDDPAYVRAGLSYVGVLFARDAPFQHGAAAALTASAPGSNWFFGLDYTHFTEIEIEAKGVTMRLERHPAEAFAGLRLRTSSLHFDVRGALAADYIVRTTEQTGDGFRATSPRGRWLWAFSTRLGVAIPTWPRIYAIANVGAEFLLNPYDQVIGQTNGGTEVVGSPLLVRPRLELGATISVW